VIEQNIGPGVESRNLWDHLKDFVRGHIQRLLVEEVNHEVGSIPRQLLTRADDFFGVLFVLTLPDELTRRQVPQ
jgi:hypothetical protein